MSSSSGSFPLPPSAEPYAFSSAAHGPSPVWPPRPDYLTDSTRCPACFTPLSSSTRSPDGSPGPVCSACGLDLSGSEAAAVFAAGTEILTVESRRQKLLAAMRVSQSERAAAARAAAAAAANARAAQLDQLVQTPVATGSPDAWNAQAAPTLTDRGVPVGYPTAPPAPPIPTTPAPLSAWYPTTPTPPVLPPKPQRAANDGRPRRSGIQILMLTVGIILVSIMAIFFVLLAYLLADLTVRSVLTGVASVAVFGVAMLLHRRRLFGTAEGIAVLAIVLLLLDVWIVRANNLFGSAGLDGWLYTGIATGILAAALMAGFRILPLRSLSTAAALLTPFAVFATTFGLLTPVDLTIQTWAAFTAVGAAALVWRWIPVPGFEQGVVRLSGLLAAAIAIVPGSVAFADIVAGPAIALTVLALVWFGHLALSPLRATQLRVANPTEDSPQQGTPTFQTTTWHLVAALGLGITVSAVGPALFSHATDPSGILWIPASATMAGALLLALAARLGGRSPGAPMLRLAAAVPLAISALLVAPAAILTIFQTVRLALVRPFSVPFDGSLPLYTPDTDWAAPVALLVVPLLAAVALGVLRQLRPLGWIPAAFGGLGLIAASLAFATPTLTGIGFLVVAAAAVIATASQRVPMPYRSVAACLSAVATFGLFIAGLTNTTTFPLAALATLALLVALHGVVRRAPLFAIGHAAAATVLATATLVLLGTVPLLPSWFQTVTGTTAAQAAPALLVAFTSLAILVAIPLSVRLFSRVESATLGVIAAVALGIGLAQLAVRVPADATPFLVTSAAIVAVAVLWQLVRTVATWPERYVAAIVAPLVAVWFGSVLWDQIDPAATPLAMGAALVLLAAAALLIFRPVLPVTASAAGAQQQSAPRPVDPAWIARVGWDSAIALASAPVMVQAFASDDSGWVALLVTAVAALIIASGEGGVFAGRTPRRHVAWAGLPLAVSALWLALARNNVDVIEYYTLPVAGLLLAILALILLRRAPVAEDVSSPRTVLFIAALAIAILPSAVAVGAGEPLRTILTLAAAAVLILGGPFLPAVWHGIRVAAPVWLAGATTMLVTVLVTAVVGSPNDFGGWENEAAAASLLAGGALWVIRRQQPRILGPLAAATAPVVVALPLAASILDSATPFWEFLCVLLLVCALYVVTSMGRFRSEIVRWTALGAAVILSATAMTTGLADPFETATMPIALALLAPLFLRRAPVSTGVSSPRTTLFSAALALAILPSAVAVGAGEPLRTILTLAAAAVLILGGPFLPAVWHGIRAAAPVWLAGATTMLVTVLVIPLAGSANDFGGWENEAAAASLLAGGALWVVRGQQPRILGPLAAATAPVVVALPLAASILDSATPFWEFLCVLLLVCALYVVTSMGRFRSEIVRWTALGAAVILSATAMTTGLADPFETATVPIALALLTSGAVRLVTDPASRSWPHLGAGTALLLVPSLLADFTGTDLVRIVALGVGALAVFGAGLALKLGAPTVIGATVLIIHALAQLWPWISGLYGAIPWWLWAGVGGVILIVFAATYEKRIRDLRTASLSIASLR